MNGMKFTTKFYYAGGRCPPVIQNIHFCKKSPFVVTVKDARCLGTVVRMDMQESTSLSQGVFVEKPRRKAAVSVVDTFGDFQPPIETIPRRAKLCRTYLERIKSIFKELEVGWNGSVAEQVDSFLQQSLSLVTAAEIVTPLGFVPSGLSGEENSRLFDVIENHVRDRVPFLARVNSSKCSSVKMAFQTICKQLLRGQSNESQLEETDGPEMLEDTMLTQDVSVSSRYLSIHDLQKWYESTVPKPTLVAVIMEDADCFPPSVIPQLLHLMSSSKVPILFLFGGNHCTNNFERLIPHNASTTFTYKTFRTTSGTQRLNKCISKILNDEKVPLKFSGAVLSYLSSFFISQHFSLTRLLQAYQVCLMDHFQKAESIFCTDEITWNSWDSEALLSPDILRISYESMEAGGESESKRGKGTGPSRGNSPITDIKIKERINLTQLQMQEWLAVLNLLYFVKRKVWSGTSVGSFRELYIECASGSFFESTEECESSLDRILKDMNLMTKSAILELLKNSIQDFEEFLEKFGSRKVTVPESIQNLVDKFQGFCNQLEENDQGRSDKLDREVKKQTSLKLKGAMKLRDLQATLRGETGDSGFMTWKSSFIKFIRDTVRKYLKPVFSIPGSGVFVYSNLSVLKTLFSPLPQSDIVSALRIPGTILECDCCKNTETGSIDCHLPDSSILFKLLQEQMAKKVDLNSIYESFASIVEAPKQKGTKSRNKEETANLSLLRFRQAVGELQHVGIVKRSKNKGDEVTKLLWL